MTRSVVFKLGGSLLGQPGLAGLIRNLLDQRRSVPGLWVIGGGAAADIVREWDALHGLGEEAAHWLAIEALELNETLVHRLCPEFRVVRSGPQFSQAAADGVPALCCAACFVRWGEAAGHALPHTWNITSDSIAAWTSRLIGAQELVLVKSLPAPTGVDPPEAAQRGLVDPLFPQLASGLPRISWCNGRDGDPQIVPWCAGESHVGSVLI